MRCSVHTDRDAVGICQGCGAGVCTDCRVTVAGRTYCNPCLEAGRYRPPPPLDDTIAETPSIYPGPKGQKIRSYLELGLIGMLLLGIGGHLLWLPWAFYFYQFYIASFFLIGLGTTLGGLAFLAFHSLFESELSRWTGIFSIFSAWLSPIIYLFFSFGLVFFVTPILYFTYSFLYLISFILFPVTLILWACTLVITRDKSKQSSLATSAGILFVITAHIYLFELVPFLLFYLDIVMACMLEAACILAMVLVYRVRNSIIVS